MAELTGSLEDYLETIYILLKKSETVRITDIAKFLALSKPSVNRAVKTLKEADLVIHEKYGTITLTKKGEEIAKGVYFRHETLMNFLVEDLKIEPKTAEQEACRIEHDISEESLKKLMEYSKKHKHCFHEN